MKKVIRITDMILAPILIIVYTLIGIGNLTLPDDISTYSDGRVVYNRIFCVDYSKDEVVDYQRSSRISPSGSEIKLFGAIPVKNVNINQRKPDKVYVSGESFGIKLYTDGVIVVGTRDVQAKDGKCNPAKEAGIEIGDIIVELNGKKVYSSDEVTETLNDNNGRDYSIKIKRNGSYKSFTLSPVYSPKEGCYKVGLWVRDSTAGIGTITFYNPDNNVVAALGHPIVDVDTNEIMPILNGEAVKAEVTKVYKGSSGEAGALGCEFKSEVIGTLKENSSYGIYGKYDCKTDKSRYYEVAVPQEVERGPAQLLCTVNADGPKLYNIEISKISYRENNNERNMVVKITDESLLKQTGGIVQGMSGSPIIQNGRLVGALTHVIVDNPEKGYAIFAEKMLDESEKIDG